MWTTCSNLSYDNEKRNRMPYAPSKHDAWKKGSTSCRRIISGFVHMQLCCLLIAYCVHAATVVHAPIHYRMTWVPSEKKECYHWIWNTRSRCYWYTMRFFIAAGTRKTLGATRLIWQHSIQLENKKHLCPEIDALGLFYYAVHSDTWSVDARSPLANQVILLLRRSSGKRDYVACYTSFITTSTVKVTSSKGGHEQFNRVIYQPITN